MPKVSSQSSKALQSGFGMQEGVAKVIDAKYGVHEFRNKEGDVVLAFFGMQFDYVKCDETGAVEDEEKVMQQHFIISFPKKTEGEDYPYDLASLRFHPGKAKSADDQEPEDLGTEVGTTGNTMYCETTAAPFADSDYMEFMTSLEKKGWKPEINDQSFAPNYVGLIFKFHTEAKKLRADAKAGAKPQTRWVVDDILVRPYEQKGKKSQTSVPSKSSTAGSAATTAADKAPSSNGDNSDVVGAAFVAALNKVLSEPSSGAKAVSKLLNEDKAAKLPDFMRAVVGEAALVKLDGKKIPPGIQKEIAGHIKDYDEKTEEGFIETHGAGLVTVDREAKEVSKAVAFD